MNQDLLDKCFETILNQPQKWDQQTWNAAKDVDEIPASMLDKVEEGADAMCGATACLAGHAMLLSGQWTLKISSVDRDDEGHVENFDVSFENLQGDDPGGDELRIGARLLGLPYDVAEALFYQTAPVTPEHYVAWAQDCIALHPVHPSIWDDKYREYFSDGVSV